jgi:release factor glutamine methyltransferase
MNSIIKKITTESGLSTQEAWWLLESITQKQKEILLFQKYKCTEEELTKIDTSITKIKDESIPLAYLIGNVPFGELTINVQPPILIPRPETEEWVYKLIDQLEPYETEIRSILDLGTGSGCIALALAHAFPEAQVTATDINPQALSLAQQNADQNKIKNIDFLESNLFQQIPQGEKFDLIVSNPPYIASSYKKTLDKSVINWEDHGALFAPEEGLELIKKMINQLPNFLSNIKLPTKFVVECDPEQIATIISLCKKHNLNGHALIDSFGNQRTVWAS